MWRVVGCSLCFDELGGVCEEGGLDSSSAGLRTGSMVTITFVYLDSFNWSKMYISVSTQNNYFHFPAMSFENMYCSQSR